MLKLAGEFIEGQLTDHLAELDAHVRDPNQILRTGEYHYLWTHHYYSTRALSANTLYVTPLVVPRKMTFDRIAIDVNSAVAGKSCRLGIYNDGANLYPGSLVLDAGEVSVATVGIKAITINQQLTKGLYWVAVVSNGTPTLEAFMVHPSPLGRPATDFTGRYAGWTVSHTYGALPDPFTAGGSLDNIITYVQAVMLRLASLD